LVSTERASFRYWTDATAFVGKGVASSIVMETGYFSNKAFALAGFSGPLPISPQAASVVMAKASNSNLLIVFMGCSRM
jgi:hypothetical protein